MNLSMCLCLFFGKFFSIFLLVVLSYLFLLGSWNFFMSKFLMWWGVLVLFFYLLLLYLVIILVFYLW